MPTIAVDRAELGAAFPDVTGGLAWKLARLRSMSPAEVAWRIEERLALAWLEARSGRGAPPLERPAAGFLSAFRESSAVIRPPLPQLEFVQRMAAHRPREADALAREAELVREGRIRLFGTHYDLGSDPARWPWNRSPDGGPIVPLDFGPTLDYRDPSRVGNARLAWELARMQWLAAPAMSAYLAYGHDARADVHVVVEAIEAFNRECPVYRGLQWSSSLEFALRSLSWGWALALVAALPAAEEIADERWGRIFAVWAEAMRFVDAHDSRHSSANNHRLGEAAGLAWAGHALSFLPEAEGWRTRGMERMEAAFLEQTDEHGITREQAFGYQQFVLDFVVTVEAVARRGGREIPLEVLERVDRVAYALDAFSPQRIEPLPVGDGDEGRALPFPSDRESSVRASVCCAIGLTESKRPFDVVSRVLWLGLDRGEFPRPNLSDTGWEDDPARSMLPDGAGYAVLRWCTGTDNVTLLFDAAPLGLGPLYAHGHADALQVVLQVEGTPVLVDPGTGAYHSDPALRNRLRATRAHNTIEIDGQSQSRPGGLFQWFDAAPIVGSGVRRLPDGAYTAAHEGYRRLGEAIVHRRRVKVIDPEVILVTDRVAAKGPSERTHRAVARWHLGALEPEPVPGAPGHVANQRDRDVMIAGFGSDDARLRIAEPTVWAPEFLRSEPCSVLEIAIESRLPMWFVTVIVLGPSPAAVELEQDGDVLIGRVTGRSMPVEFRWNTREDEPRG